MGVSSKGISIESLRQRLKSATGPEMKRVLSETLAADGERLALKGFRESKGPDGTPWREVKRKGKPLIDTGNLRASLATTPNAAGFLIGVRAPYAPFQQFGTKPHERAGGVLRQNARGRFVRRTARTAYLTRFKPYVNQGITPRPMLPQGSADLAPIWMPSFEKTTKRVARARLTGVD